MNALMRPEPCRSAALGATRLIHAQPLGLAKAQEALGGGAPDRAQSHLLGHLVAHLRDAAA
jgi:hypothetical protein